MHTRTGPKSIDAFERHVAELIRARRLELGLSQSAVAQALGVTFQQMQKYESGSNRLTVGRLRQLAEVLGVSPGWFFEQPATPGTPPHADHSDRHGAILV